MKEKPSSRNAGHASRVVEIAISASTARTTSPATRARPRKMRSDHTSRGRPCVTDPAARWVLGAVEVMRRDYLLDLVDLRVRLLQQRVGQRREARVVREVLCGSEQVADPA